MGKQQNAATNFFIGLELISDSLTNVFIFFLFSRLYPGWKRSQNR
jgi:hypothetical protein